MSGLVRRLAAAFVAPPAEDAERGAAGEADAAGGLAVAARGPRLHGGGRTPASSRGERPRPEPAMAVLLCRREDAAVAGGATALVLAKRSRASAAVVALWGAGAGAEAVEGVRRPARGPATSRAQRLAARLAERGHDAVATGRLALLWLADDLAAAAPEAVRAHAAAGEVPFVVVLARPRDAAADALLREADHVLVARSPGGPADVAELAAAGLAQLRADVRVVEIPQLSAPARTLAAVGIAATPPTTAAIEAALEATR
jgi:hypothetical protein